MIDKTTLWIVIAGLAAGSFALRFLFLGVIGNRPLPPTIGSVDEENLVAITRFDDMVRVTATAV